MAKKRKTKPVRKCTRNVKDRFVYERVVNGEVVYRATKIIGQNGGPGRIYEAGDRNCAAPGFIRIFSPSTLAIS